MKLKTHKNNGFTLIELMITVAIIGILSSIALPAFQNYVAQSSIAAAVADLNPEKTRIEIALNEYKDDVYDGSYQVSYIQTGNCSNIQIIEGILTGETVTLQCTIKGISTINGKLISFVRDHDTGQWDCSSNADVKFLPKECKD